MKPYFETKLGKLYNCDFLNNELPDKCANLIISDPPYFKVKGEFDFSWETFGDYLKDVELWAVECKRLLADNGTLFWWGNSKKIAYTQIILDKHFNIINNLVWDKGSFMGLENSEDLRSFAPCSERLLMYGTGWDVNSLDKIMFNPCNFESIKKYLKEEKQKVMAQFCFSPKQFNEYTLSIGCSTTPYKNWFCNTTFWEMATKTMYEKLQVSGFFKKPYEELRQEYEELRQEYEELRQEYEELRRPFKNELKLQEVLRFGNESVVTGSKYKHDTVKPEHLTRALITTCSRNLDFVVIPFAGSGTESAMCVDSRRKFSAYEIKEKYCSIIAKRIEKENQQLKLF